ncbi:hypothetical protein HPSA20_1278 [Helicobacter pylori SouthAfrica20]|uniref:Uncharacterized protein n=1 Tax=Helicobacter pylori SouthAfrica20 TaxID=1352356 RepID=T1UAT2_HELPX|nr:hypothetical protein HPSA20_1278 [Helicobacter pylori SouthAfrica20]
MTQKSVFKNAFLNTILSIFTTFYIFVCRFFNFCQYSCVSKKRRLTLF